MNLNLENQVVPEKNAPGHTRPEAIFLTHRAPPIFVLIPRSHPRENSARSLLSCCLPGVYPGKTTRLVWGSWLYKNFYLRSDNQK